MFKKLRKPQKLIPFIALILCLISCQTQSSKENESQEQNNQAQELVKEQSKPNIIFILADDLGYGDLSCYGQTHFQTPNIDRLAQKGMKFTNHYAGSTVCAPSRSCFMTGLHTGHTPIRGNQEVNPEGQTPLPKDTPGIAKVMKEAGYTTGAFGKWGLGFPGSEGDPNQQGFDEFFGYNCQRLAHHYYPEYLWENHEKYEIEENKGEKQGLYAPHLIHDKTLAFIENNKDKPFFLFVPSVIPHAELFAPEEDIAKYRGKFDPEKNYEGVDSGPKLKKGAYGSQPESHAAFAAMIEILDRQVGEILDKLEALGLAENTIIMFSSDNGPHQEGGADPDYFDSNGPLKGYKRDVYEGGIRVPMLVSWPGTIKPETESDHISAFWDILPTAAALAGIDAPSDLDGISFLPTLLGTPGEQKTHEYLYWEFGEKGGRQAIRMGKWKAVKLKVSKNPNAPIELYDLENDLGEDNNIADQNPEIVKQFEKLFKQARVESEQFRLFKAI